MAPCMIRGYTRLEGGLHQSLSRDLGVLWEV